MPSSPRFSRRTASRRPTCRRPRDRRHGDERARTGPRSPERREPNTARSSARRELTYEAICGLLASVKDRYTTFLSPKEYAALNEGLDGGNFSGVGIAIRVDDDTKLLARHRRDPRRPGREGGSAAGRRDHDDRRALDEGPDQRRRRQAAARQGRHDRPPRDRAPRRGAREPGRDHARGHPSAERLRPAAARTTSATPA